MPSLPVERSAPLTAIPLAPRELLQLDGDNRWRLIICHRGSLWITQERDLQDYLLETGDIFLITLPGEVLVQALEQASVEITPSLARAPYRCNYPVLS